MSTVVICIYSGDWPLQFARIHGGLEEIFADQSIQVEHIGSTAVPGLSAKPVIDVVLGADTLETIETRINDLERSGYQYVSKYEQELPMRRYFTRSETTDSLRVHVHGVVLGSRLWREHIAFRDALRSDGSLRAEYQSLKTALAARFPHDKASYTAAKQPFVRAVLDSVLSAAGTGDNQADGIGAV